MSLLPCELLLGSLYPAQACLHAQVVTRVTWWDSVHTACSRSTQSGTSLHLFRSSVVLLIFVIVMFPPSLLLSTRDFSNICKYFPKRPGLNKRIIVAFYKQPSSVN